MRPHGIILISYYTISILYPYHVYVMSIAYQYLCYIIIVSIFITISYLHCIHIIPTLYPHGMNATTWYHIDIILYQYHVYVMSIAYQLLYLHHYRINIISVSCPYYIQAIPISYVCISYHIISYQE